MKKLKILIPLIFLIAYVFLIRYGFDIIRNGTRIGIAEARHLINTYEEYLPYTITKYYIIGFVLSAIGGIGVLISTNCIYKFLFANCSIKKVD